jgi:uncharacterized protein CbrC (UPF0167 family)
MCCGEQRGFVYAGPVYANDELRGVLCPWCIADGSAHTNFDAEFTSAERVGWPDRLGPAIVEEVAFRTPGFNGWQQERWVAHCADAAAFLGPAGAAELTHGGLEAVESVRVDVGMEGQEWERYAASLNRDLGPTAYIFRCLHCGRFGGYSDCH